MREADERADGGLVPWMYVDTFGHGPILLTTLPDRPVRAHCCHPGCGWAGPDREWDTRGLAVALDDAVQHWHRLGFPCGRCFWCREGVRCGVCGRPRAVDWAAYTTRVGFPCGHCDDYQEETK